MVDKMSEPTLEVRVNLLPNEDIPSTKFIDDTETIFRDIRTMPVESASLVKDSTVPAGTMGEPLTLAAIAIILLPSVLPTLIEYLKILEERRNRKIIELEISKGDKKIKVRLDSGKQTIEEINAWLQQLN